MSTIPSALPAINTLLAIGSAGCPQTFQTIANVGDMGGPSFSADTVDVTSHSNDNPWDQWVTTLLRGGEVPIPLFFIPSSGANPGGQFGHGASSGLMSVFTGRELRRYRLIFPDAASTTWYFDAFISNFAMKAPVAGVETADVTFKITGQPLLS